ncbi:hypothetical protein PMAYCL1PPCAC_05328, partial [Pristionchus mayeri]
EFTPKIFSKMSRVCLYSRVAFQLFELAGVKYEKVTVDHESWDALKESCPYKKLPVLLVEDGKIGNGYSICRYIAIKHGLSGQTHFESAVIDSIAMEFLSYQFKAVESFEILLGRKEGDKALARDKFDAEGAKFFPHVVRRLKQSTTGFLVGEGCTWVDVLLAQFSSTMVNYRRNSFAAYPELATHSEFIRSIPKIAEWIEANPHLNSHP